MRDMTQIGREDEVEALVRNCTPQPHLPPHHHSATLLVGPTGNACVKGRVTVCLFIYLSFHLSVCLCNCDS